MKPDRREAFYQERVRASAERYPGFDRRSAEVLLGCLHTSDLLQQLTGRYLAGYGLSKSSFNILMLLRLGPTAGMQLHDLGEMLLVSRANVTGLIDHMEQKGFVTRVVDTQDRRARVARITAKAEALLDKFIPVHYRNITLLLRDLSVEDKGELVRLLAKARMSIAAHYDACERIALPVNQALPQAVLEE